MIPRSMPHIKRYRLLDGIVRADYTTDLSSWMMGFTLLHYCIIALLHYCIATLLEMVVLRSQTVTQKSTVTQNLKRGYKKNLCSKCTGLCCRYFALPLEDPEDWDDYDDIRWYLTHEDVTVFVEDDDWYLNVKNKCRHLSSKDYKCEIYDVRPKICRGYKVEDCDFTATG